MTLDHTVFVQIVLFLFLWFLLNRIFFKPFVKLLEEREGRTEGLRAQTDALAAEAERLRRDYETHLARAREEAATIRETILNEARATRERILAEAREEAAQRLANIRHELQQVLVREREIALREAESIGRQMAEKVLGRRIG